jgi:hypothetical protein
MNKKTFKMNKYLLLLIVLIIKTNNISAQKLDSNMIHKLNVAVYLQYAYNEESNTDKELFGKIEKDYKTILAIDSLNLTANYGLGSLYFNEAIYEHNKLGKLLQKSTENNMPDVNAFQKKIDYYYALSKPYLDRYHRIKGDAPNK